jgi:hypothetical protein
LDTARVYGRVQIPADFSAELQRLPAAATQPGQVTRPVLTISTNPRAGELGGSIAGLALGKRSGRSTPRSAGSSPPRSSGPVVPRCPVGWR